jgi:thiamine kinase-like enzyme
LAGAAPAAQALRCVPGLEDGQGPQALRRLEGGSVNDSWYVESALGRFVLRVDGPAWRRPGVDRRRERALHEVAAGAGLAPRVLRWGGQAGGQVGVQVREFLDGRTWTPVDLADAAQLRRLGARLARLHACALPADPLPAFDPVAITVEYLELARRRGHVPGALRVQKMLGWLAGRVATVAAAGGTSAVVHGDLTPGNLIDGSDLWLIDFEYAQLADPLYDYGSLLACHPRLLSCVGPLLADSARPVPEHALLAARDVHALLAWAWRLARNVQTAGGNAPPGRAN